MTATAELVTAAEQVARARALTERTITEHKSLDGAIVTQDDNSATICFSVYNVVDYHGDVVRPGAFTKSITEAGALLPLLWNHDLSLASLGVVRQIYEVPKSGLPERLIARFPEAAGGMMADVEFFDTPRAQEIVAGLKKRAPYQASYAFDILQKSQQTTPDNRKVRVLEQLRLHELTVCHFGANPATYLSKAAAHLLDYETKAGRRHSSDDTALLNQIAALVHSLGATNITLLEAEPAAPPSEPARTDTAEKLLGSVHSILFGASP